MDALAVSAAVIQFVEVVCGLISKGIAIYSSMTGLTVDHNDLQNITEKLSHSNNDIQQTLRIQHGERGLTSNEKDLQKLAVDCQGVAEDTENLKLCVASRPWNIFEDAFKDRPSLMLQDLSATDIEHYITSQFATNEGFAELQVLDRSSAKELLETISKKAEGVFLWVHLVVKSLLEGLTNGDGLLVLLSRLEELPPNLEDLYAKILKNLSDRYLGHASRLFQLVGACDGLPTLLCIALADLEDSKRAIRAPVKPMSDREKTATCKNMKRKLASRCLGRLDISSPAIGSGQLHAGDVGDEAYSTHSTQMGKDQTQVKETIQLLDEMGKTATVLTNSRAGLKSVFSDRSENKGEYAAIFKLFEEYTGNSTRVSSLDINRPGSRNDGNSSKALAVHRGRQDGYESDKESNTSTEAVIGDEVYFVYGASGAIVEIF
ncbi:hypothetical protein O1611_g5236 [Lasiodiplodia mahajangana]|uniref:Uncharacterized protein n=1 Tax=Lasiodiplodia mahajangana TaxID=1108764 RepID=A0ACC2JMB4_9PEZI|nr:hypothetical protein O1611_g5236 [Lasiodiplodia mahajangana]